MASASLALHPPATSFPFPTGARGHSRSRPHWAPPAAPAPLPPVTTPAVPAVKERSLAAVNPRYRSLAEGSVIVLSWFEEGAEQFRLDVAANPNDTEESIWCFLCEAQLYGVEEARKRFLEVGLDSRPVMREAYALFKDGGDPEKLVSNFSRGTDGEIFYSSLYAGLYYESQNDAELSKSHIVAACKSPYGSRSGDYMASLAFVHCQCRNWSLD
ncbi:hypothetical protein ACP70R_033623 [Stipagrostis hirtigluma subsp. patula]